MPLQTTEVKSHKRTKRTHDEIMESLPVEEVFNESGNKSCDKCGSEMTTIGIEKIRDELVYVLTRLFLCRHVAKVVKCTSCGMEESRDAELSDIEKCNIRTPEVLASMIPHSFCSPEHLAHNCVREILQRCRCIVSRKSLLPNVRISPVQLWQTGSSLRHSFG